MTPQLSDPTPRQHKVALLNAVDDLARADYQLGCALKWIEHAGRPLLLAEVTAMFKSCIAIREGDQPGVQPMTAPQLSDQGAG